MTQLRCLRVFKRLSRYTVYDTGDNTPHCLTQLPTGNCLDKTSPHLTYIICDIYISITSRKTMGHLFHSRSR